MGLFVCGHGRNKSGSNASQPYKQVDTLPETGESGIVYMIPSTDPDEINQYLEYVFVNNSWELYGGDNIQAIDTEDKNLYLDIF